MCSYEFIIVGPITRPMGTSTANPAGFSVLPGRAARQEQRGIPGERLVSPVGQKTRLDCGPSRTGVGQGSQHHQTHFFFFV